MKQNLRDLRERNRKGKLKHNDGERLLKNQPLFYQSLFTRRESDFFRFSHEPTKSLFYM